jgi:hypothetical protein
MLLSLAVAAVDAMVAAAVRVVIKQVRQHAPQVLLQ